VRPFLPDASPVPASLGAGALVTAFFFTAILLTSCAGDRGTVRGSGTIEMDEVDVSSLVGGRLSRLTVSEGDTVRAGDTLAVLDRGEVSAELAVQAAQANRAQAQARDLTAGARPSEVLVAREQLAAMQADRRLAEAQYARTEQLAKSQSVSLSDLDRARATRDAALAHERAAAQQLQLQEEGFRRLQVSAARDAATAAMAQLAGARSRAGELVLTAPRAGVVLLVNFEAGEVAAAGVPVVTLGDPDHLWMRVYVAAPKLAGVRIGAPVDVRPIGAKTPFPGRVVSIATKAEFTPRAALTEEEQANLVFGVKVALEPSGGTLKPGLPAEARIRNVP
jgi:HlyD family secretion protein